MTYFIYYSTHVLQFPYTLSGKKLLYFLSLSSGDQVLIYQNIWSTELKLRKQNNFLFRKRI